MRTIAIIVYPGSQLLDVTGPASVFVEASVFAATEQYRVVLISSAGGPVETEGGVKLDTAPLSSLDKAKIDTLLLPGAGRGAMKLLLLDEVVSTWFVNAAKSVRRVGSVCTGAFALAAWGLLDGRRATTHWQAVEELAQRFPSVCVDAEPLFIEDDSVWTSAGVSTGIDMALAIVEKDVGKDIASQVAKRLVLYLRRPGHQSQFSALLKAQDGLYSSLITWIADNLTADLRLEALAAVTVP